MTLRIQTPDGMKRLDVGAADTVKTLYEKVHTHLNNQVFF